MILSYQFERNYKYPNVLTCRYYEVPVEDADGLSVHHIGYTDYCYYREIKEDVAKEKRWDAHPKRELWHATVECQSFLLGRQKAVALLSEQVKSGRDILEGSSIIEPKEFPFSLPIIDGTWRDD